MITLIKQWIALKDIISLGMQEDFSKVEPEKVLETLQRFAISRLTDNDVNSHTYSSVVSNRKEHFRSEMLKASLLRIWQLSRERLLSNPAKRGTWHTVMANCNALYEPYTRSSSYLEPLAA